MSAIAGFVSLCGAREPSSACQSMLASLREFGSDEAQCRTLGPACFGRSLLPLVPEDDFDRQPLIGGGGRFLLVADARIDNRSEIAERLGLSAARANSLSDADLLMSAWERWGLGSIDHLLGDIALAVWDAEEAQLTLIRTPLSLKPLFHDDRAGHLAFASMPAGLLALEGNERRLNLDAVAAYCGGGLQQLGSTTLFEGISAVPQGHAVIFRNGTRRIVPLWSLDAQPLNISVGEAGEALRSELDRAVAARLRRWGGRVACQLSAGRDSGAVAASAALNLEQDSEQLIALTSAPRLGFTEGADARWLPDESWIAARAAGHGRMLHLICRPEATSFAAMLDRHMGVHFQPFGNPASLPWLDQISRRSAEQGASVLLSGAVGNFTISAGGTGILPDYLQERGFAAWWRLARGLAGNSPAGWRHMLNFTFAPRVPRTAYAAMMKAVGRHSGASHSLPILKGGLRTRAEAIRENIMHDTRPERSYRALIRSMLSSADFAEKMNLALWGVDARDPTADRRLVELCLSLPAEAFVAPGQPRPAYAAAFADRLLPEVIEGARPGYQSADWYETINPTDVAAAFARYFRHPLINSLFDRPTIDALIANWPTRRGYDRRTIEVYCNQLLVTMSLASFIVANFPDA